MFKVGDKVFDFTFGWGEVSNNVLQGEYPVIVRFKNSDETYTKDGRRYVGIVNVTLSHQEYGKDFTQERPEPQYVPFIIEDAKLFRDRWIREGDRIYKITVYHENGVETEHSYLTYEEAFDQCTFEDGSKFGKLLT